MEKQSLKILLVEDDDDDAFLIKELIFEGFPNYQPQIDHLLSANEVLNKIAETPYDLCMFDYRLGEVDGLDLLRKVRAEQITTPIIFLTGQGDQEIAVHAMKAGASDYLTKSKLSVESITQSIRYVLNLHREARLRQQAEDMLQTSHEDLKAAHRELQDSMEKLKTAQSQILRSEKLASIGTLAAGVCHEILNPLNIISGHAQALLLEREDDKPLYEDMESIQEEIHRIEKIINGLLKFSREGNMEMKNVDINQELESVLVLLQKEINIVGINIEKQFAPNLPPIFVDGDCIRQVFLNIINNAKHAMGNGGTFTVSTESITTEGNFASGTAAASNGNETPDTLRIKFADTGTGIKKENLAKIFDPFFTTKPEDQGTGLGLSLCHSIVEKHGGTMEVESELGKGTTFILDLPMKPKEAAATTF